MSTSKKKAAGLSALANLSPAGANTKATSTKSTAKKPTRAKARTTTPPPSPSPAPAEVRTAESSPSIPLKGFNLSIPVETHEKLREMAFHEKKSMTALVLDGLDMLFTDRGLSPIPRKKV